MVSHTDHMVASYHNKIQNRPFSELGTKKNTEIGPASLAAKPGSILKGLILIKQSLNQTFYNYSVSERTIECSSLDYIKLLDRKSVRSSTPTSSF